MADLTLYGFPQSSYTWTARIACEEKGITHDLEPIEFGSDEHRALHPYAKIPVMKHGDFVLYETTAICNYIDAAFDGPALRPSDPRDAAEMVQWISSFLDYCYGAMGPQIVIQRLIVPSRGGETDEAVVKDGVEKVAHQLSVMEARLSKNDYLAGDGATIADFMYAPIMWWMEKTPEGAELYSKVPGVNAWRARIEARPSFQALIPPMPQAQAAE